jgi:AcrR family transcriptional regulator
LPLTTSGPSDEGRAPPPFSWRELAVARSLDSARTRAEDRVQRFLDAALDLLVSGERDEFTVQEVVERSGQSLRSFYQYFGGKHELLLALLEESLRTAADRLSETAANEDDALDRLHRFVVEYYVMCRPAAKGTTAGQGTPAMLVEFAQQLLTARPTEAAGAFLPVVSLFERILDDAAEAGAIRSEVHRRRIAGVVLESIMFDAYSATIAGSSAAPGSIDAGEELWSLFFHGIATGSTR